MIERGICSRHRAEHTSAYHDYLGVSAYFDDMRSYRRAQITAAQLRVIAQALPEAIAYRIGTMAADRALAAAYAELARQLGLEAGR